MATIAISKMDLLIGNVLKVTKMSMKQIPCAKIRCRRNDYSAHTKMYYVQSTDFWALDNEGLAQVGDTVLIRRNNNETHKFDSEVQHLVERVIFKFGVVIDPITGKRCIGEKLFDEIELQKGLVEELVEGPMAEAASYNEQREMQLEKLNKLINERKNADL